MFRSCDWRRRGGNDSSSSWKAIQSSRYLLERERIRCPKAECQTRRWNGRSVGYVFPAAFTIASDCFFSVMRKDAVYTLLLNITLFPGMRCTLAQDPRYLRFTAIENGVATTYNLKVSLLIYHCWIIKILP